MLVLSSVVAPSSALAAPLKGSSKQKDVFAGDVWHAVKGSWPGTMTFDGVTKKVKLAPVGAAEMEASYTYTIDTKGAGELRMTLSDGRKSAVKFVLAGKELTFEVPGGKSEHYLQMSKEEEVRAVERLKRESAKIKSLMATPGSAPLSK